MRAATTTVIDFPFPVATTTVRGDVVHNEKNEPVIVDAKTILFALIESPAFYGQLKGARASVLAYDAVTFVSGILEDQLRVEIPNTLFSAFKRALAEFIPRPHFAHCLHPYIKALDEAQEGQQPEPGE